MQHQRFAQKHAHHAGRKSNVTTEADHHVGLDPAYDLNALPKSLEQTQWQKRESTYPFAADTGKINGLKHKPTRRHQLAFHAGMADAAFATQPVHTPAPFTQSLCHGQAGENMATGPPGHDHGAFHSPHACRIAYCAAARRGRACWGQPRAAHVLFAHARPPRIKRRFS